MFDPAAVILQQYLKLIKRRNSKNFRTSLTPRKADYNAQELKQVNHDFEQQPRTDGMIYFHVGLGIRKKAESRIKRRAVKK